MNRSRRGLSASRRSPSRPTLNASRRSPNMNASRRMSPSRPTLGASRMSPTRTLGASRVNQSGLGASTRALGASPTAAGIPAANVAEALPRLQSKFVENPTAETKLRLVFGELDVNGSRSVSLDHFRRSLQALKIGYSPATVEDLFQRADLDKLGAINYTEFLNFAKKYPLLIEAIYSRSKDIVDRMAVQHDLDTKRANQEELQRKERLLQQQLDVAKEDLEREMQQMEAFEGTLVEQKQNEKDRNTDLVEASRQLHILKAERTIKDRDYSEAQDVERQALKPLREVERKIELTDERIEFSEEKISQCLDEERQLEAMLEEAKRNTMKEKELLADFTDQLAEFRSDVAELAAIHEEAEAAARQLQQALKDADDEVLRNQQAVEEAELVKQHATANVKRKVQDIEDQRAALLPFRDRKEHQKLLHRQGLDKFNEADDELQAIEGQLADRDNMRAEVEASEQHLLENEVRLREQRKNINERDDVLWDEGTSFLLFADRGDTRLGTTNGQIRGM